MEIRAVEAMDIDGIKEIIDQNTLFPSEMLDTMLYGYLSGQKSNDYWLTIYDSLPIAVAYYTTEKMTEGTWNLLLIATLPEYQSKGLGTRLINFIEDRLKAKKQRLLIVETSGLPEFEATRRFYKNYGFSKEAVIKDFYQAGEDKVIFTKPLNR